jgi:hypothetical protein
VRTFSEAVSSWTFGWDALVAVGTICLAVATVVLGWITRNVAKATADEVQSQNRPVLLPASLNRSEVLRIEGQVLDLRIRNGGKGPAFEIRCRLDPGGLGPEDWSNGILEQAQSEILHFRGLTAENHERFELHLDYLDLAGRRHSSSITMALVAKKLGNELKREHAFLEVSISEGTTRKSVFRRLLPQLAS